MQNFQKDRRNLQHESCDKNNVGNCTLYSHSSLINGNFVISFFFFIILREHMDYSLRRYMCVIPVAQFPLVL